MAECTEAERALLDALRDAGNVYLARWAVFLEWAEKNPEAVERYERAMGLERLWAQRREEAFQAFRDAGMPESEGYGHEGDPRKQFYQERKRRSSFYRSETDKPFEKDDP